LRLNSPDLDAFSLFHQLPDTARRRGGGHFVSLKGCERGLQAVVNGYQFETSIFV